jgi:hypothetical protein
MAALGLRLASSTRLIKSRFSSQGRLLAPLPGVDDGIDQGRAKGYRTGGVLDGDAEAGSWGAALDGEPVARSCSLVAGSGAGTKPLPEPVASLSV